jgi:hypothetical protein
MVREEKAAVEGAVAQQTDEAEDSGVTKEDASEYIDSEHIELKVQCTFDQPGTISQETISHVGERLDIDGVCCLDGALEVEKLEAFTTEFLPAWDKLDARIEEAGVDRRKALLAPNLALLEDPCPARPTLLKCRCFGSRSCAPASSADSM